MDSHWKQLTKHHNNHFPVNIKNICPVFIEKKTCLYSVESGKFEVLGTRNFISNYQKFELKGDRHKNI